MDKQPGWSYSLLNDEQFGSQLSVRVEGFPGPQIPTAIGVPTRQALEASKGIGLEPKEEMDEEFGEGAGLVMLCHGCDGYVDMMNTEARLSSVSLCTLY